MRDTRQIDAELRLYVQYLYSISDTLYQIEILNSKLTQMSLVKSPHIKSVEEAKYQSSPKTHEEEEIIKIITERDELSSEIESLIAEYKRMVLYCNQFQKRLSVLDDKDLKLIGQRYFQRGTLRRMAEINFTNRQTMYERIIRILEKLTCQ